LESLSEAEIGNKLKQKLPSASVPAGCGYNPDGRLQCLKTEALSFLPPSDVDDPQGPGEAVVSAKNLLKVLRHTRARPAAEGRTEPVG